MPKLSVQLETRPIDGLFTISRASVSESYALIVTLQDGQFIGRGECEPDDQDPTVGHNMAEQIYTVRDHIEQGIDRQDLLSLLPRGPARNAVDCALWDLESKQQQKRAWDIAGIAQPKPLITAYTLSIDSPEAMAAKAAKHKDRALLKVKLDSTDCLPRIEAIRKAAPKPDLIVDANEAWTFDQLNQLAPALGVLGVRMIEQPLPNGEDDCLTDYHGPIPLCADESCLDRSSLPFVLGKYQFINIKLDKTGGLTEALLLAQEAQKLGLQIMVGCMVGTSLAMAPATLVAQMAAFVDLDGPLLLAEDREHGLLYRDSLVYPPNSALWG